MKKLLNVIKVFFEDVPPVAYFWMGIFAAFTVTHAVVGQWFEAAHSMSLGILMTLYDRQVAINRKMRGVIQELTDDLNRT